MTDVFDIKHKINEIDRFIRQSAHNTANKQLALLLENDIPRRCLADCAALARRLGKNYAALALLRPFVRPSTDDSLNIASDAERAEYAQALVRIGAVSEAERLLKHVDPLKYPRSLLFRAFAKVSRWEYFESESHLKALIKMETADPYDVLVAKLNLAASLTFRWQDDEAFNVLEDVELIATRGTYNFILSAVWMFRSELYIHLKQWRDAEHAISVGESLLVDSDTIDAFLLKKQRALLELYHTGNIASAKLILNKLKTEALARRHFESVRDCDYHLAVLTKNFKLARHLYHGTPYPSYRERLSKYFPQLTEETNYRWNIGNQSKTKVKLVDPSNQIYDLKKGQVPHRLFNAYCNDFYRPKRLLELYNQVFPENNFFPRSSADQVYQANKRLKEWFDAQQIPLKIVIENGFWSLAVNEGCVQVICHNFSPSEKIPRTSSEDIVFRALNSISANSWQKGFSAPEISERLNLSDRSGRRYLKLALDRGWVTSVGHARATRYFFCTQKHEI